MAGWLERHLPEAPGTKPGGTMPAEHRRLRHDGLKVDRNPLGEDATEGPPEQSQDWPGSDQPMRPQADHGEHTCRGGGKLEGPSALTTSGDSGIGRAVAIAFGPRGG
jgi:hypothetical protein